MSTHDHDDGLVHGHHWAREALPEGITRHIRPVPTFPRPANDMADVMNAHPEDGHDEGLVHGHAWASAQGARIA